jgi:hypothetical protein
MRRSRSGLDLELSGELDRERVERFGLINLENLFGRQVYMSAVANQRNGRDKVSSLSTLY